MTSPYSVPRPPKRNRTGLIVGACAAVVVLLIAAAAISAALLAPTSSKSGTAAAPTDTPAGWCGPNGCFTAQPAAEPSPTTPPPAPSPTPSKNETCADSARWAQDGGTALIDAYINNQSSGNISVDELKAGCPQFLPIWQQAQGGIGVGQVHAVPGEVKPGTYETTSADIESCYWERLSNGQTLDNNFVTASKVKLRVTIRSGDDTFVSKGCGNWVRV
jgi:hypothetical protein